MKTLSLTGMRFTLLAAVIIAGFACLSAQESSNISGEDNLSVTITVPSAPAEQPAQSDLPAPYDWRSHRHSICVTVGAPTLYGTIAGGHNWSFYRPAPNSTSGTGRGDLFCGNYGIEYTYNILRWLAFGINANYEQWFGSSITTHDASLMAVVNFTYINREHIVLYSGINTGLNLHVEKNTNGAMRGRYLPAVSLTPIGIRAGGKHVYGLAELGIGATALFKVGIGGRF